MFTEIFGMLSSLDVKSPNVSNRFRANLSRNHIRSISAFSSNSIFYFPMILSDQITPDEHAMVARLTEKSCASFVIACVNLMPFHRIKSDDKASVEDYLRQFHQNLGMEPNVTGGIQKFLQTQYKSMSESASEEITDEMIQATQDHLYKCWMRSYANNTNPIVEILESVSVNDKFNISPIDDTTKVLLDRYRKVNEEISTWGFIGEATDDMFELTDEDEAEYDDDDEDFDIDSEDASLLEASAGSNADAMNPIIYTLESVTENKIMNCKNLTKLASLEAKLKAIKRKYVKYLNRYKRKYTDNKKNGSNQKLVIRFNGVSISDPKAFMVEFGKYIKIVNQRLKMIDKRRAQLRKRRGEDPSKDPSAVKIDKPNKDDFGVGDLEESALTMEDVMSLDYVIRGIDEAIIAKDEDIFSYVPLDENVSYEDYNDAVTRLTQAEAGRIRAEANAYNMKRSMEKNLHDAYDKLDREQKKSNASRRVINAQKERMERDNKRHQNEMGAKQEEINRLKKDLRDARSGGGGNPPTDTDPSTRNASNIQAGRALRAQNDKTYRVFDRQVFTDMDMRKANEAIPTFAKATIGFVIDDTEETVSRDILIGIKAYTYVAPAKELITDVYNCVINRRKFLKFIKFVTGEERSLSDLIFGIKELRTDALDGRKGSGQWRAALRRRKRWSKMSVPFLTKEYTPNGTVVMTMNEVDFIKKEYGVDIMDPKHIKTIMDNDFLLSFIVLDQANEMIYVTYDGQNGNMQQYTYAMMIREQSATSSDRLLREIYRSMSR